MSPIQTDTMKVNKHTLGAKVPKGTHHNCLDQNYPWAMSMWYVLSNKVLN